MLRLVLEPNLRKEIGQKAAAYMRRYHALDVMGRAIQARFAEIEIRLVR
jgi:hypothetical protein